MPSCIYKTVRLFSNTLLGIFFNDIEYVGTENLPTSGPVILVGNHKNQFVDSMVVLHGVKRTVSFIIAEVSMHKPVIGKLAKALRSVPVIRPQDKAVPASGKIVRGELISNTLIGEGTKFTTDCAQKGCLISIKGLDSFLVSEVVSDTEIRFKPKEGLSVDEINQNKAGFDFKVIPKLDQHKVFDTVHDLLLDGGLVAIFPEGGSSDRTDLLPLKAGVTIMGLGAAAKGAPVKIVPYGINYVAGHAFRSKVFVEIGQPLEIDSKLVEQYSAGDKREACNKLLSEVEDRLRGVTINAPNYATLKILRTARRMYQGSIKVSMENYLKLSRRFSSSYDKWKTDTRFMALVHEIAFYLQDAHSQGLTDKQVRDLPPLGRCKTWTRAMAQLFISLIVILVLMPFSLPGVLINYPVVYKSKTIVRREMKKAVAGSKVKIDGRDVAATQTILAGLKILPFLYILYAVTAGLCMLFLWEMEGEDGKWYGWLVDNLTWILPLFILIILPFYSMLSVIIFEHALPRMRLIPMLWVQLKTLSKRNSPGARLRVRRKQLAIKVQNLVEELISSNEEWENDRVITHEQILSQRRESDRQIAISLNDGAGIIHAKSNPKLSRSLLSKYES